MKCAVYRIWHEDQLLYVGASYNPWLRYGAHQSTNVWAKSATRMDIQWFETRAEALRAERVAIATENPALNKQDVCGDLARKTGRLAVLAGWISEAGMTQAEFAETCGIHYTAMSRIMNSQRVPTRATAVKIAEVTKGAVPASHWRWKVPKSQDPAIIAKVAELYPRGETVQIIGKLLGVSSGVVMQIVAKHNIRKPTRAPASKYEADLRCYAAMGMSQSEAGRRIGINPAIVCGVAKRLGLSFADGRKRADPEGSIPAQRAEKLRRLAQQGFTISDAARKIGIPQPTASKIKSAFGIEFKCRFRSVPTHQAAT